MSVCVIYRIHLITGEGIIKEKRANEGRIVRKRANPQTSDERATEGGVMMENGRERGEEIIKKKMSPKLQQEEEIKLMACIQRRILPTGDDTERWTVHQAAQKTGAESRRRRPSSIQTRRRRGFLIESACERA